MKRYLRNEAGSVRSFAARLSVVACVALSAWGCTTSGCMDNRSSLPLAGFYSSTTGAAISLDKVDIGGVGAPGDSLLLASGTSAKEVYLPLRSTRPSADFFIAYRYDELDDPDLNDTISLTYTSYAYFASEECGAMMRYRITDVEHTRHLLDSVAIIPADSIITNVNSQNMRLYFRTDE